MDDLNRLYQLVAAREAGDLSDHGAEVLGQLAVRMPEEYEAATRPRVRVPARFNETNPVVRGGAVVNLPTVSILDGDGALVWSGTLTQFARDNSRDLVRECIAQWRASLEVNGRLEPAFIGGGAAPHFQVLL